MSKRYKINIWDITLRLYYKKTKSNKKSETKKTCPKMFQKGGI